MRNLEEKEADLFYRLYHSLLCFSNGLLHIFEHLEGPEELLKRDQEIQRTLADALFQQPEIIDSFAEENPYQFTEEELQVVRSWKHAVQDRFLLFRHLKRYSVFLCTDDPPVAYGVLGLSNPIDAVLDSTVPVVVSTVLLPFKGQIVYDGILLSYSITFGGGAKAGFNAVYQEAKSLFGIVTSLPFSPEEEEEKSPQERLKFYLQNKRNREVYAQEIQSLIASHPNLLAYYHREMGKKKARTLGKRLRKIGIENGWFAVYQGLIIASGEKKGTAQMVVKELLPSSKRDFVYYYQLQKKR